MGNDFSGEVYYKETKRIIYDAMINDQLVIFVGAGASRNSGIPLWGEAMSEIANRLGFSNYSDADILKIPQYYYNSRGKKEYTELMRYLFKYGVNLVPNSIHREIIKYDTSIIVTTNYDNLLEKAAEEAGKFMQVISQDTDFPYCKSGLRLIKMHGDFYHDNFVLKEDDYTSYSENFRLMEVNLKALIGTKVVLFVGYSLNDPDVKQIFMWAKSVLRKDVQRAYMILPGKKESEIEKRYYENIGVNLIYGSQFSDSNDLQEQTIKVLKYLQQGVTLDKVEKLYDYLKPFEELLYVKSNYIENAFRSWRIGFNRDIIHIYYSGEDYSENKFLKKVYKALLRDKGDLKEKVIANVIRKSRYVGFYSNILKKIRDLGDKPVINKYVKLLEDCEINFDYKKIKEIQEQLESSLDETDPMLYLQYSYVCNLLNENKKAYRFMKMATTRFYKNRMYTWYFISEFNRKNIARYINVFGHDDLYDEKLINLESILKSIPDLGNDHNKFLRDICNLNFAKNFFYKAYSQSKKVNEQANTEYLIFVGSEAYNDFRENMIDYYKYTSLNYMTIDKYKENIDIYDLYIRTILASVLVPDKGQSALETRNSESANIHEKALKKFDIFFMLKYFNASELTKILNAIFVDVIPIDENEYEYLRIVSENICNSSKYIMYAKGIDDPVWKLIVLLSHVSLTDKLVKILIKKFLTISSEYVLSCRKNEILNFIKRVYRDSSKLNDDTVDLLREYCSYILDILLCDNVENVSLLNIFVSLSNIMNSRFSEQYNDSNRLIKIREKFGYNKTLFAATFLDANIKHDVWGDVPEFNIDSSDNYLTYCYVLSLDLIEPKADVEDDMINWLERNLKNKKDKYSNNIDNDSIMPTIVNLYLMNKIINSKKIKKFIKSLDNKMWNWIVDMKKYDYTTFKIEWLNVCHDDVLKKAASIPQVRKQIITCFKEECECGKINDILYRRIVKFFI